MLSKCYRRYARSFESLPQTWQKVMSFVHPWPWRFGSDPDIDPQHWKHFRLQCLPIKNSQSGVAFQKFIQFFKNQPQKRVASQPGRAQIAVFVFITRLYQPHDHSVATIQERRENQLVKAIHSLSGIKHKPYWSSTYSGC